MNFETLLVKMETLKQKHLDCAPTFSIPLLKKYGIFLSIIFILFLCGSLFNLISNKNPELIPHADWCHHSRLYKRHNDVKDEVKPNGTIQLPSPTKKMTIKTNVTLKLENVTSNLMYIPLMPRAIPLATASVFFIWPMLPILLHNKNSLNEAKLESLMAHALGQSCNFAVAEILRTQIMFPEDLFLDKCNISPEDCLLLSNNKVSLPLYLSARDREDKKQSFCNGQFSHNNNTLYDDNTIIYNSLHHYPDVVCLLFGASLVSYFTSLCHWRILNPVRKNYHRQTSSLTNRGILVLSDIAMLSITIVYLYFLIITYDYFQLIGVFLGILLQLMINRIISYEHTTPLNSPIIQRKQDTVLPSTKINLNTLPTALTPPINVS